jgi:SHS2 domain-containing protein
LGPARRDRPARRWGRFPTTADIGLWATGPTAASLLEGLGLALYGLFAAPAGVRPREERVVRAAGRDAPELVVAFLGELLALAETEGFLGRRIDARTSGRGPTSVVARLRGEPFDPARHVARTEVKAITYHGLLFDPRRGRARVIVDL